LGAQIQFRHLANFAAGPTGDRRSIVSTPRSSRNYTDNLSRRP